MPFVTDIEKAGIEKGLIQGKREAFLTILEKRFGKLPLEIETHILRLPETILDSLAAALFSFSSVVDLQAWLESNS